MDNKVLRAKAQDYIEENGIDKNTYQVEKAFIDGAKMVLSNSSNDIQNVIGIDPSKQKIYSKIESIVGLSLEGEYSGNVELWTKLFEAGWKREL